MAETTCRQQRTMEAWQQEELNNPSRTDHYLMQLAQLLYQQGRKGAAPSVDKFKLTFKSKNRPRSMTPEERKMAIERSKSRWMARVKGPAK